MPLVRLWRTTTLRLALLYLGLFLTSVAVILAVLYWSTQTFLSHQTRTTVEAEINGLEEQYRQRGLPGLVDVVASRSSVRHTSTIYLLTGPDYLPLAGNLSAWPTNAPAPGGWIDFDINDNRDNDRHPHHANATVFTLAGNFHLLVGRDLRELEQFQQRMIEAMAVSLVLTIGLGGLGGVLISRRMMQRIEVINRTTQRIRTGLLQERVPMSGSGDELDQLAGNLNTMLDQIEALMAGMRHVTESIAHDLRTPLTRLRSRLEITLLAEHDLTSYRQTLQDTIGEADRLLATFAALLSIAEAESGRLHNRFEPVALAGLAQDVVELYEPLAEEKGLSITLTTSGEPQVMGIGQLLSQALTNLLDNAIKYTPAGGHIDVEVVGPAIAAGENGHHGPFTGHNGGDHAGGMARLIVADSGPGIPEAWRDRVLQRFVRLEWSRSSPGNGLGLSLVDAVARLHGARLLLEDNNPGLRIALVFNENGPSSPAGIQAPAAPFAGAAAVEDMDPAG
ncbi:MAG: HAMP domain-containing sensor histidine kinase [Azospirillaceae bacterium]|nr:HAMP domain-containing sensor histidine kinase [Azospirillaceae bacterium]